MHAVLIASAAGPVLFKVVPRGCCAAIRPILLHWYHVRALYFFRFLRCRDGPSGPRVPLRIGDGYRSARSPYPTPR